MLTKEEMLELALQDSVLETLDYEHGIQVQVPVIPRYNNRGRKPLDYLQEVELLTEYRQKMIDSAIIASKNAAMEIAREEGKKGALDALKSEKSTATARYVFYGLFLSFIIFDTLGVNLNYENLSYIIGDNMSGIMIFFFSVALSYTNLCFVFLGDYKMAVKTSLILPVDFIITSIIGHQFPPIVGMLLIAFYALVLWFNVWKVAYALSRYERCNILEKEGFIKF